MPKSFHSKKSSKKARRVAQKVLTVAHRRVQGSPVEAQRHQDPKLILMCNRCGKSKQREKLRSWLEGKLKPPKESSVGIRVQAVGCLDPCPKGRIATMMVDDKVSTAKEIFLVHPKNGRKKLFKQVQKAFRV